MMYSEALHDFNCKGIPLMGEPVKSLDAIYFEELSEILPDFKEVYASGQLKCTCCNQPLNKAGIHSVEVEDGKIIWICQNIDCVLDLENKSI